MDLYKLRSFVAVASVGSATKAARQLHVAQPAVSQHIQALESELGVTLFERQTRGMRLTQDGLALVGHARALLARAADMRLEADRLVGEAHKNVRVAATSSLAATLLPEALRLLGTPNGSIRLILHERATPGCLALLARRSVDFALVRDCMGSSFDLEPILEEPLVLAIGYAHPLASNAELSLADLSDQPFVLFRRARRERLYQAAVSACIAAGFAPKIICEGAEVTTMGILVVRGLAVAIAPETVVHLWPRSEVRTLPIPDPQARSSILVARFPGDILGDAAQRLIRAIRRAARHRSAQTRVLTRPVGG